MKVITALALGFFGSSFFCVSVFADDYCSYNSESVETADAGASSFVTQIDDIYFADPGFHANVFYDGLRGADGITVISKNCLTVVNEFGPDGPFVFLAERGGVYSTDHALSTIGAPLVSPDDLEDGKRKQLYIADGQAQSVFMLPRDGGIPVPFVTPSSTGSDWFNPFGVAIAPVTFDGPNVDPGDLIIADNGFGDPSRQTVWAVNQESGVPKIIAQGPVFEGGPLQVEFGPDGTLYVFENFGPSGMSRISIVSADGSVSPFVEYIPGRSSFAVHPKNGDLYFTYGSGMLYRKSLDRGTIEVFAYNLGRLQSMEFSQSGLSLFISARGRSQIIEIAGKRQAWGVKTGN